MRLGLLADIHEDVDRLRRALAALAAHGAERLVMLGDVFDTGRRLDETTAVLAEAGAGGVWGNHDFGLSFEPDDEVRRRFTPAALAYMTSLRPRLEIEDCLFAHVEPWLDPCDLLDLWHYDGSASGPEEPARCFAATARRLIFLGHFHRWSASDRAGRLPWDGTRPLEFEPGERYLVAVHAVCDGWCALLDTTAGRLVPIALGLGGRVP